MRTLKEIAGEIYTKWNNVNYAAMPYLTAMRELNSVDDMCMNESGRSVVRYFLSNASTFRGADAKRIKDELKSMLK